MDISAQGCSLVHVSHAAVSALVRKVVAKGGNLLRQKGTLF